MNKFKILKFIKVFGAAALALALFARLASPASASYSDVAEANWYHAYVENLTAYGIVNGYPDGTFRPENELTRGEFLKLLVCAVAPGEIGEAESYHWAGRYLTTAVNLGITNESEIVRSAESLDSVTNRYEMARLLVRASEEILCEPCFVTLGIEALLPDYPDIPDEYVEFAKQAYAKGLLNGYAEEGGAFMGSRPLTRAQAAAVILRLLDPAERTVTEFGPSQEGEPSAPATPVALLGIRERNHLLFGDADKDCFESEEEAHMRMTAVTVDVWRLNETTGEKYASKETIIINSALADDVRGIFKLIFEGDEQFPIKYLNGFSWGRPTGEHSKGAAIDINYNENPYVSKDGTVIVGSHYLPGEDPYSIVPDGDVVSAFYAYGWGWGGEGWWSNAWDYMHFSIDGT